MNIETPTKLASTLFKKYLQFVLNTRLRHMARNLFKVWGKKNLIFLMKIIIEVF